MAASEPLAFCDLSSSYLDDIKAQRLEGTLDAAGAAARDTLKCQLPPGERVALLLELASIEDRIGLHQNIRQVTASLDAIEKADVIAADLAAPSKAAVELAKANYFYRDEMSARKFEKSQAHAERAIEMFEALGDKHGQADAVHRLGLIHFQRRQKNPEKELTLARELFDESLALDQAGGARAWFCGEYGRHMGFIHYVNEDYEDALPLFEQSLQCRKDAGAIDAAMFAAQTLGSTFVRSGFAEKAEAPLLYGLVIANYMNSPVGKMRISFSLGEMYTALGDGDAARLAYNAALKAATDIGDQSYISAVRKAHGELGTP